MGNFSPNELHDVVIFDPYTDTDGNPSYRHAAVRAAYAVALRHVVVTPFVYIAEQSLRSDILALVTDVDARVPRKELLVAAPLLNVSNELNIPRAVISTKLDAEQYIRENSLDIHLVRGPLEEFQTTLSVWLGRLATSRLGSS